MQRRAAAAYVALFLVLGAGSYGIVATAHAPAVSVENPDHTLTPDATFTVNDREYEVVGLQEREESGGGHGGGGGVTYSGTVQWTNQSAIYEESWDDGGSVTYRNTSYVVQVPNESDPATVTLREEPGDDVETIERDGTTYVVLDQDGDGTEELTPLEEWDELDRVSFDEGETIDYADNDTTITNVSADGAQLQWRAPRNVQTDIEDGDVVELNGQEFVVHFESGSRALLSSDIDAYETQLDAQERFHERENGFWGITIVSGFAAGLLIAMAFLPRKDV